MSHLLALSSLKVKTVATSHAIFSRTLNDISNFNINTSEMLRLSVPKIYQK